MSAAAGAQQAARTENLRKFAVVTLGQCIPLLGLIPQAHAFRAELARLGSGRGDDGRVSWTDYSSPTDWGSFALVDPIALCLGGASGVAHPPRMASPRFHTLFEPARYMQLRRDKRRMHLQYLMAGELPSGYDYFSITAGPLRAQAPEGPGNSA